MSQLASVIIVSQGRPNFLTLTLDALRYQTLPEFEVIVVGGLEERRAVVAAGFSDDVYVADFRERNIAAARNIGIAAANGEFVAFLDDDAVPGPGWLHALTDALATSGADIAAGYVRGPDGVGFQFSGAYLFEDATHEPIEIAKEDMVIESADGRAVEAMGTNAAYSRAALKRVGGFDPGFCYFLDESDLNWRLALAGAKAVIVPRAQVVHALAASLHRSADRVPLTLFDIGRSTRLFLGKHFQGDPELSLRDHRSRHKKRLLRHVAAGRLDMGKVPEILATFVQGTFLELGLETPRTIADPVSRSNCVMRGCKAPSRLKINPIWRGKESLTYCGGGVWEWRRPRLRRGLSNNSTSGVREFTRAQ